MSSSDYYDYSMTEEQARAEEEQAIQYARNLEYEEWLDSISTFPILTEQLERFEEERRQREQI